MQAILGIFFHFIGGFASGSFYIPFKKVKGWSWESYWIIGGLFSWLIVPPVAAYLTIPNFADIISATDFSVLKWTYIMGVLWGIGGLTYGLGVRYLGVSLGSSIILGLCSVFGSIIPSIYYDIVPTGGKDTITHLFSNAWGQCVLLGLLVCVIGIIICGKAGAMKDKDLAKGSVASQEFKIGLGLAVAIVSGVLSACFSFGIEAGSSMSTVANDLWTAKHPGEGEFLYRNNVIYVVLLWGGLTTNFIWCMILNARNKTFGDYTNNKTPLFKNYLFSALAGTTWFLQFFFYGMGESRLGNGASSWILHMAFIILIANAWGLALNEWKGVSKKTKTTIIIGILVILASVLIVGYGNYLKPSPTSH
ncbi:L-rhamnose/proton symporter RhaT [uncultured Chitinophaga sp.]|uniref:L-rhamnose/proton symporter RhaT n=1 Tax=uncultured Chitinophaga sp. TaxID=339340 RepID=UPI002600CEDB|nr:L-rhamnose/proton symporter RhaT [uncultured Chitinophaga sp.]